MVSAAVLAVVANAARAETIKVGVTPGPHAQILEAVKPIAAKNGLDIQIVEFTDYVVPNAALDAGDLQANSFQNQPYLDNQKADRGYKIEAVGLTVNFPMGSTRRNTRAGTRCRRARRCRSPTIRPMAAAFCFCCRTRAS
jgi:D-methionine transport system substrate-binding protein